MTSTFIEEHHIYNNDILTIFVILLLYLSSQIIIECKWKRRIILILLLILICYNPEPFRLFQTEHIIKRITVEKIITHDTRKTYTFINLFDKDKSLFKQHQTGEITTYITSTNKEMFILSEYLYPKFMTYVEPLDTITIKAFRYTAGGYFRIYSFK